MWLVPLMTVFDSNGRSPNAAAGTARSGARTAPSRRRTNTPTRGEVGWRPLTLAPQTLERARMRV